MYILSGKKIAAVYPISRPEILHTLDPSFLSFPALSAGAYTTTLVVMEAVVS
jgi:hypothetical protein